MTEEKKVSLMLCLRLSLTLYPTLHAFLADVKKKKNIHQSFLATTAQENFGTISDEKDVTLKINYSFMNQIIIKR